MMTLTSGKSTTVDSTAPRSTSRRPHARLCWVVVHAALLSADCDLPSATPMWLIAPIARLVTCILKLWASIATETAPLLPADVLFPTSHREAMRRAVFADNVARVRAHNDGDSGWKMAINEYSDLTPQEFAAGRLPSAPRPKPRPSAGGGRRDGRVLG